MYTLGQAAKATGKSKSTISQSISKGRISAEKDDSGRWRIDPAELHRVFPPASSPNTIKQVRGTDLRDAEHRSELLESDNRGLRDTIEVLKAQVEDLRTDRDAWRDQAQRKRLTWRGLFGGGKAE